MKPIRAPLAAYVVLILSTAALPTLSADVSAQDAAAGCIAIVTPVVEGMPGNSQDVARGVRDLMASYLNGPSVKVVVLDARLASPAAEEAKQKGCEPLLLMTLTRKSGDRGLMKALGQVAGPVSWPLAGGSSVVSGTVAGLQTISSLATSTKSRDKVRLEYRLQGAGGQVQFGPRTETQTASIDGEDLLTPVIRRAAEAIVSRKAER